MERQEEVRSERIELLDGCGLLSVNDAMVRRAVVPAGLFLLIFPCSLCWLMVRIGSEAEKRCGLNLVTLRPVLSPCCVLPLCLPFCLIPFCSLVHIFSSLILSASICLLCPHFLPIVLRPFLSSVCQYHCKKECMTKVRAWWTLLSQWGSWHEQLENSSSLRLTTNYKVHI